MRRLRVHYAWVTLFLCFLGILAAQGVRLAFGAFVEPWERTFEVSRSLISLVSFVSFIVYGLSQPIIGRLVDRYGVRRILAFSVLLVGVSLAATAFVRTPLQLMLLYGGVASIGFGGASGVAASVAVTKWFHTRRGLAFGIVEAGFAAGQLALVPTSLMLIAAWGWRDTMLVLGIIISVVVFPLLLLLIRSTPRDIGVQPYGADSGAESSVPDASRSVNHVATKAESIWRSRAFWGLSFPFFICGITTTGMIDTHLIPFAHDHGYTLGIAGATVSVLAAFNILGTLASGPLSDLWDNRLMLGVLYAVRAVSLVLLLTTHNAYWLLVFGALFGLVNFAVLTPTHLLASRYFAGQSLGYVFGLLSLAHQLGSALGAYLPAVLYDLTGSYTLPFAVGAGMLVVGAFASFTLPRISPIVRQQPLPAGA